MAAFVIADIEVTDPDLFAKYGEQAGPTIAPFDGKALVLGGETDVVEGDWQPNRLVILEFPSLEQARAWYNSPAYQKILPLRLSASRGSFLFVEGI